MVPPSVQLILSIGEWLQIECFLHSSCVLSLALCFSALQHFFHILYISCSVNSAANYDSRPEDFIYELYVIATVASGSSP